MPELILSRIRNCFRKHLYNEIDMKNKKTHILKPKLRMVLSFITVGAFYGALINFVLWSIFKLELNIYTLFGYGWFYWFIRFELPVVIIEWKKVKE